MNLLKMKKKKRKSIHANPATTKTDSIHFIPNWFPSTATQRFDGTYLVSKLICHKIDCMDATVAGTRALTSAHNRLFQQIADNWAAADYTSSCHVLNNGAHRLSVWTDRVIQFLKLRIASRLQLHNNEISFKEHRVVAKSLDIQHRVSTVCLTHSNEALCKYGWQIQSNCHTRHTIHPIACNHSVSV